VRIIVGFPSGGPSDILTRLIGQWLSQRLGQPFIVENRPGATGNIATEAVVTAPSGRCLRLRMHSDQLRALGQVLLDLAEERRLHGDV
jgi:tripartite-type tricarboxylate transporter receptor subunit TctC